MKIETEGWVTRDARGYSTNEIWITDQKPEYDANNGWWWFGGENDDAHTTIEHTILTHKGPNAIKRVKITIETVEE